MHDIVAVTGRKFKHTCTSFQSLILMLSHFTVLCWAQIGALLWIDIIMGVTGNHFESIGYSTDGQVIGIMFPTCM